MGHCLKRLTRRQFAVGERMFEFDICRTLSDEGINRGLVCAHMHFIARTGECRQQKHTQHAPSTKTECDYLNGWIKKRSHTQKSRPKMVNPRDIAGEWEREKKTSAASVSVCRHVELREQSCGWGLLCLLVSECSSVIIICGAWVMAGVHFACCWDLQQPKRTIYWSVLRRVPAIVTVIGWRPAEAGDVLVPLKAAVVIVVLWLFNLLWDNS